MDLKTLAAKAIEEWNAQFARGEITEQQCREGIQRIQEAEGVKAPAFDEAAERAECSVAWETSGLGSKCMVGFWYGYLACAKRKAGVM